MNDCLMNNGTFSYATFFFYFSPLLSPTNPLSLICLQKRENGMFACNRRDLDLKIKMYFPLLFFYGNISLSYCLLHANNHSTFTLQVAQSLSSTRRKKKLNRNKRRFPFIFSISYKKKCYFT